MKYQGLNKFFNCFKSIKQFFPVILIMFIAQASFAAGGGVDILADPASNLFATFKGTGVALLIVAEIVGAYTFYRKTGDMKAWIGLPVLLIVTGWAATQF